MKYRIFFAAALCTLVFACKTSKKSTEKGTPAAATTTQPKNAKMTTASGLQYEITRNGTGIQPKAGDKVTLHYTGKFLNDSVFDSSIPRNQPLSFTLGIGQVIKGWDEGVALMHVGDKARFTIPPQLAYGEKGIGPIPPNATLVFDVELLDAKAPVKAVPFDIAGKPVQKTASGLEYVMVYDGKDPAAVKAEPGKTVTVHYTGYFRDGKIFDSSVTRGEPFTFLLGRGQVIPGWDEGIALLKVGQKAHLIIPYNLAYGENGRSGIPPKSDLIFDVELLGVK